MRLGVLIFGAGTDTGPLLDPLRRDDVDVVEGESPVTDGASALREGGRVARADADAVLLLVADPAAAPHAASAVLHVGCPLLLASGSVAALADAAGPLAEAGVSFDRLRLTGGAADADLLRAHLQRHERRHRQRGVEAALKLYGQRLALPPSGASHPLDAAQWLRQFGVVLVPDGAEADFHAPDGDAHGALTRHLLRLLSGGEEPPATLGADDPLPPDFTYARMGRQAGRFVCVAFAGTPDPDVLARALLSSRLHGVPGDNRAALRAACEALDITCRLL